MTYHTNHCWCNESCWDNKNFDGKVMVYFKFLNRYEIKRYINELY